MQNRKAILSVCIGSYNRKELLLYSLSKLLAYEGDDLEVVVVDNASTDGSWESISKIDDDRLKIFRNQKNMGAAYNCNAALFRSTGSYVMNLNDRDYIETVELEKYILFLKKNEKTFDVIINSGEELCLLPIKSEREKAYNLFFLQHPGYLSYSRQTIDKFKNYSACINIKMAEEFKGKYFVFLLINSSRWGVYGAKSWIKTVIDVSSIPANRVSFGMGAYFTPRYKLYFTLFYLFNKYIPRNMYENYSIGVYMFFSSNLLHSYYNAINNYEVEAIRYTDFQRPRLVCYLAEMVRFYVIVCIKMKKHPFFSRKLKITFWQYSIRYYCSFVNMRLKLVLKKILPDCFYFYFRNFWGYLK